MTYFHPNCLSNCRFLGLMPVVLFALFLMGISTTSLYAQQNAMPNRSEAAGNATDHQALPASFPKYTDTGNTEKDTRQYETAKQAWIAANKQAYEELNEQSAKNAIDYDVPTPMPAMRDNSTGVAAEAMPSKGPETTYEEREKARLAYQQAKAQNAAAQQGIADAENTTQDQEVLGMLAVNKDLKMTPYLESIFQRMKDNEFPGNMMTFVDSEQQKQARTTWIMQNEDLYQLFVWASQSTDGKIHLSDKEYEQLSEVLKEEIRLYPNEYIIE